MDLAELLRRGCCVPVELLHYEEYCCCCCGCIAYLSLFVQLLRDALLLIVGTPFRKDRAQASGGWQSRAGTARCRRSSHACMHACNACMHAYLTVLCWGCTRTCTCAISAAKPFGRRRIKMTGNWKAERSKEPDRRLRTFKNSNFGDTSVRNLFYKQYRRSVIWMHSKIKSLEPRRPLRKLVFRSSIVWYTRVSYIRAGRELAHPLLCQHSNSSSRQLPRPQLSKAEQQPQQPSRNMVVKVAINGFGRIGRCLFRFLWDMSDVGEEVRRTTAI